MKINLKISRFSSAAARDIVTKCNEQVIVYRSGIVYNTHKDVLFSKSVYICINCYQIICIVKMKGG